MKVLVTGGAGYIGSHTVRSLLDQGHEVVVYDNLSKGHRAAVDSRARFVLGDIRDTGLLLETFRAYSIEAVLHFAAFIEVGESVKLPGKYYQNNVACTIQLLNSMVEAGVRKIVFSSTAAVYGNPARTPILETENCSPINPYGRSKWMSEMIIRDFSHAHELSFAILRYFNVAGAWPDGHMGEDHEPESHLIPRILQAGIKVGESVKIFGTDYPTDDGTCIRDYLHVLDLAQAHILALENLRDGEGDVFNLGSESGFSVREVISVCEKVMGKRLNVIEESRRAGDPAVLVASSEKTRSVLGWKRKYPELEDIVKHAWLWHSQHPHGYRDRNQDGSAERSSRDREL